MHLMEAIGVLYGDIDAETGRELTHKEIMRKEKSNVKTDASWLEQV